MTRRRWIADKWSENRAALLGEHAEHLSRVLRAHVGQTFEIACAGVVRIGRITDISSSRVDFELGEAIEQQQAPAIAVALAIFKFDRFEWAIEKLTELGAAVIIPFAARRTDAHLIPAAEKRIDRWRRVALAASEQSRRAAPPQIAEVKKFRDVLTAPAGARIVLSEYASPGDTLTQALRLDNAREKNGATLALGPEGGWTEGELQAFGESGWMAASLGSNVLRAETAAIAAMAIVTSELGPAANKISSAAKD